MVMMMTFAMSIADAAADARSLLSDAWTRPQDE